MVGIGTELNIADNSGGKVGYCIKIKEEKSYGKVGDRVLVVVTKIKFNSKVKRKAMVPGLLIRTSVPYTRKDGTRINFDDNSVILLSKKGTPVGNRIKGPLVNELRLLQSIKTMSVSSKIL